MKAPGHPWASGDRQIARLTLRALVKAGFAPEVVSDLRVLDIVGDAAVQADLRRQALVEAARLETTLAPDPPALWFTYHCHYKAPDLLGPRVARTLRLPYAISEPSISPRRRDGPWAGFAAENEAAIAAAGRLFWTTRRDLPALQAAGHGPRLVHLPAFVEAGARPLARAAHQPLRLLTVAMMRAGDKLESYCRLGRALAVLDGDWRLDVAGDGPERAAVEAALGHPGRVRFLGAVAPGAVRRVMEQSDLLVWPGVGEGVGMALLEAQAAGLPVISEDHPAQRDLVVGPLAPPGDAAAFAKAIKDAASRRAALSAKARQTVESQHGLDAASATLGRALRGLVDEWSSLL